MRYSKILILFFIILLFSGCVSNKIGIKDIKGIWFTRYSSDKDVYYFYNYSSRQSGDEEPVYKAGGFTISYNPLNSPYKNYSATKGKYKLIHDKETGKNYIEMTVSGTGKGRLDSSFKNPNYKGEKIKLEILSVNKDQMTVLCNGKKMQLEKFKDSKVIRLQIKNYKGK